MDSRLLTGTVEMLILEVLAESPLYGYRIVRSVLDRSSGYFELKEGSLYPALHRLERQKLLSSFWEQAEGRRRKYYKLTPSGLKALAAKREEWRKFSAGVNGVLGAHYGMA
ncbi:MAG TPA: PadR family transcriptional regulator [Planctomycetaceae bacterium]|nr:PadR family transcriptional regulator [Planctomycetaceae bacterium]